ncbi:uncharacterized protein LOC143018018 [Oratosquilla oratoria]|uniref:uncharacterized protein LOC143018018 n=1 Tax=Oratosquilla oratoria TaxID=337810 RepID=UPI003F77297A
MLNLSFIFSRLTSLLCTPRPHPLILEERTTRHSVYKKLSDTREFTPQSPISTMKMHSFFVLLVLVVTVLAGVPYYQRRSLYPLNYHLIRRPANAVQQPFRSVHQPGFPSAYSGERVDDTPAGSYYHGQDCCTNSPLGWQGINIDTGK